MSPYTEEEDASITLLTLFFALAARTLYVPMTFTSCPSPVKFSNSGGEVTAALFNNFKLETVTLRYFSTYGKGENSKGEYSSVIWKFIESIKKGKKPVIYGDGTQSRDFIFIKDAARASILAMKTGKAGDVYNVGTGKSYSLNEAVERLQKVTGRNIKPKYVGMPVKNYVMVTQADPSKAKREIGFSARVTLDKGLKLIYSSIASKE